MKLSFLTLTALVIGFAPGLQATPDFHDHDFHPHREAQLLDFAGMYGGYWDASVNQSREYVNPITNASSCPFGYTASTALGTVNLDYGIGVCTRPHQLGREEDYDFGGAYGYTEGSRVYPNPVTGAASCPPTYAAVPVHGSPNLDWPVFFCYRVHTRGIPGAVRFGGFYGYGFANNQTVTFLNPANNSALCPPGYRTTQVLGTTNLDYPVFICTK